MDPIAWLETGLGKLVASVGIAVLLVGFGWVRGDIHGQAKMSTKYETLVAQYDAAAAKAAEHARVEQAAADAKSIAQAQSLAEKGQAQAEQAQQEKSESEQRLARLRAQLAEEMRHDQQAANWAGACIAGGIRDAAGLGGVCDKPAGKG